MAIDANRNNDCKSTSVAIAVPYWDLRFEILNSPDTGRQCGKVGWNIKVTNVGNVTSDDVGFISGIGAYSGPGNWADHMGLAYFRSGNLPAGSSRVFTESDYAIGCAAYVRRQYVKVEVNYADGFFDHCGAGNYDEEPIQIERTFFDLRFSIINADASSRGGNADWTVRVRNVGNVESPSVCFLTGIGLNCGPRNWSFSFPVPLYQRSTGAVAAGGTNDIRIGNGRIPQGAFVGT